MATTKPRITITLTQRQHEVLKTIADCGGNTMSGMLGEFIESAMPTFERMAATFQQVRKANVQERARILEALSDAQTALEPVALAAAGQFDLFLGQAENAAGIIPTGAGTDTGAVMLSALPSPPTNRGVTEKNTASTKPSNSKALKGVQKKEVLKKVGVSNEHKARGKSHAV